MTAVIVAGGLGTRIRSLTGEAVPKALLEVEGTPVAFLQLRLLARFGIRDVVVLAGHLSGPLAEVLPAEAQRLGLRMSVYVEDQALGTAGCLSAAAARLPDEDVLLLYGDMIADMDVTRLLNHHQRAGAAATIVAYKSDHPHAADLLRTADDGRVIEVLPRNRPPGFYPNLVPAGIYCLSARVRAHIEPGVAQDFVRDVFPRMLRAGETVIAYCTPEYLRDVGTLEGHRRAQQDLQRGRPARLRWSQRRATVFFDRDGVLNPETRDAMRADDFELLPGAAEAVRLVNASDRLAVVVTNQPQIAKGLLSPEDLHAVHDKLETLLGREGAKLDGIYHCPHHPDRGFAGEVVSLKVACECRKPAAGMILRAAVDLPVSLEESCVIGDSWRDVGLARHLGLRSYGVRTGNGCRDCDDAHVPDRVFDDVLTAVTFVLTA